LNDHARRLAKAEQALACGRPSSPLQVILVRGGLCGCKPVHATIEGVGSLEIGPDERLEDFKERTIELAHTTGARWLVIGDLPPREGSSSDEDPS
jgi:hypothetical protein